MTIIDSDDEALIKCARSLLCFLNSYYNKDPTDNTDWKSAGFDFIKLLNTKHKEDADIVENLHDIFISHDLYQTQMNNYINILEKYSDGMKINRSFVCHLLQ